MVVSQRVPKLTKGAWKSVAGLLLALICALTCILQMAGTVGQVTTLSCERKTPGGPVNCLGTRTLFSLFPVARFEIVDLREATVIESVDQDGDLSHRVELVTPSGIVPLTPILHAGNGSYQHDVAGKLNELLQSAEPGTAVVVDYPMSGQPTLQR